MDASPKAQELAALVRSQTRRVRSEARILSQLAAQLDDELTGEDTNDSPKEGTHDPRDRTKAR